MTTNKHPFRIGPLGAALLFLFLLLGCVPGAQPKDVADRIRGAGSDLVERVLYVPANFLDDEEVRVFLLDGTTEEQAAEFWCAVVVPAGGNEDFLFVYNHDGTGALGNGADCAP